MPTAIKVLLAALGGAAALLALWVVFYNWRASFRTRLFSTRRGESPILIAGPLFSLIAANTLVSLLPGRPSRYIWITFLVSLVVDPGALPLVLSRLVARLSRRGDRGNQTP